MPMTNRGKFRRDEVWRRGATPPTTFYLAMFDDSIAPTVDTNLFAELSEIPIGNGYDTAGGVVVNRNATDWDVATEDDTANESHFELRDFVFTATVGDLPSSGFAAGIALLDANPTPSSREVLEYWMFQSLTKVSPGQTLTIPNVISKTKEPA